mmetsp:Transcript_6259/g.20075  ORF Transcript_6259/g.20075 Transcript_6259/m.20075 type:complete len:295 (-) Transcript_6259:732-1616(-)
MPAMSLDSRADRSTASSNCTDADQSASKSRPSTKTAPRSAPSTMRVASTTARSTDRASRTTAFAHAASTKPAICARAAAAETDASTARTTQPPAVVALTLTTVCFDGVAAFLAFAAAFFPDAGDLPAAFAEALDGVFEAGRATSSSSSSAASSSEESSSESAAAGVASAAATSAVASAASSTSSSESSSYPATSRRRPKDRVPCSASSCASASSSSSSSSESSPWTRSFMVAFFGLAGCTNAALAGAALVDALSFISARRSSISSCRQTLGSSTRFGPKAASILFCLCSVSEHE